MRLLVALCALVAALVLPAGASAAFINVTNSSDSGEGSLRKAIEDSNATPATADTIQFVNSTFPNTVQLQSPLPTITSPVTIDDSAIVTTGDPRFEINGAAAGPNATGLVISAPGTSIEGMAFHSFAGHGIHVTPGAGSVSIQRVFVGTNRAGTGDLGVSGDGVRIESGGTKLERSTIVHNGGVGVNVLNGAASVIGNTTADTANTIADNDDGELRVTGDATTATVVINNKIGTVTGSAAIGIAQQRVLIDGGADNTVVDSNQIATGTIAAIAVQGANTTGTRIEDNLIGVDATGTTGLAVDGTQQVVSTPGGLTMERNVVGGKAAVGAVIAGASNVVRGNAFGTNLARSADNGELGTGVALGALTSAPAGGIFEDNAIAHASGDGVQLAGDSLRWRLRRNIIFDTGGLAIDIGDDGPDANDAGDADSGPNDRQNAPELTFLKWSNGISITGTLDAGAAASIYGIDVFRNAACDPSGRGEAEALYEAFDITTDATGTGGFTRETVGALSFTASTARVAENAGSVTLTVQRFPPAGVPTAISATATNPAGATSELGNCLQATDVEREVKVSAATAPGSAGSGDYQDTLAELDFSKGEITQQLVIPLPDDAADEADESFQVTLSSPVGGRLGERTTATITIVDNESPSGGPGDGGTDPDPGGEANTLPDSEIVRVFPRVRRGKPGAVLGSASDDDGSVRRVEVSIAGTTGRGTRLRCISFRSNGTIRRSRARRGRCASRTWVRASGRREWRFNIRRGLPRGTYRFASRAIDDRGGIEPSASSADGNLIRIIVR